MQVRPFAPEDGDPWDAFVRQHAAGTPFHLQAWRKSIEESFGYTPCYLLAEEAGRIQGVLPLFYVSNLLVKKALISSPFAVYGGILANSAAAAEALYERAKSEGSKLSVQYVEFRNAWPEQCVGSATVDRYVTFTQQIGANEEAILESIPRKTRYMVRKSLKQAFSSRTTRDLRHFEDLYAENLRRLGTPCFPHKYFEALLKHFGPEVDIREYEMEGRVVAAVLTFYFGDRILPYYGASDSQYNEVSPNNFMYFDLMRWGGQNGYREFDFGRSKRESGSYKFKAHWGMQERPLPYEIVLVKQKVQPNFSPTNPKYQFAIRMWQKMPLALTRALGPRFIRLVP